MSAQDVPQPPSAPSTQPVPSTQPALSTQPVVSAPSAVVHAAAAALPRGVIVLVGLAGLVGVVAGMRAFAGILAPTLLALMIVIAAAPLQQILARRMPTWLASTITLVVILAFLLGFVALLVVSVARMATILPEYADKAQNLQANVQQQLTDWGVGPEEFKALTENLNFGCLLGVLESLLTSMLGVISDLVLIVMLIFFMVFDAASFPRRAGESAKFRPDLVQALGRFVWGTQQYLIVSTIFGAMVAVLDTIALYIIGVPLAVLWGLLAFITNYIPNVGFVIGLIPPAFLALLGGGVGDMVAVIAVYCLFNLVLQSIIQPRFVGDAVGLATTLTFVSLIFWGWVLGPLGAILAVPMTLLAKALLVDIDPSARWAVPFIGSGPPAASEHAVSERLARAEAEAVATAMPAAEPSSNGATATPADDPVEKSP